MNDIVERLKASLEKMANCASVDMSLWNEHSNAVLEAASRIKELEGEVERLTNLEPDWWYRDLDPDECGDSPHEAIGHQPDFTICQLHSSYYGPTKFAFRAPTLNAEDDDTEVLLFDAQEEAIEAARVRLAALKGDTNGN